MPARASHPALATLRPPGWPRLRAPGLGLAPTGGRWRCLLPHLHPISEPARHLSPRAPRLRVSARPPHPAIKASPAPTLDAVVVAAAAATAAAATSSLTGMAGINKRRTSPASTSSSSGGDVLPQRVTRKRRSVRRGARTAARRPSSAPRPVSASEFTALLLLLRFICAMVGRRGCVGAVGWRPRGGRRLAIPLVPCCRIFQIFVRGLGLWSVRSLIDQWIVVY